VHTFLGDTLSSPPSSLVRFLVCFLCEVFGTVSCLTTAPTDGSPGETLAEARVVRRELIIEPLALRLDIVNLIFLIFSEFNVGATDVAVLACLTCDDCHSGVNTEI
jgi:hypothetical protein